MIRALEFSPALFINITKDHVTLSIAARMRPRPYIRVKSCPDARERAGPVFPPPPLCGGGGNTGPARSRASGQREKLKHTCIEIYIDATCHSYKQDCYNYSAVLAATGRGYLETRGMTLGSMRMTWKNAQRCTNLARGARVWKNLCFSLKFKRLDTFNSVNSIQF